MPVIKLHYCSFCNKNQNEVKQIIASTKGINICNECVDLCQEIIKEETEKENKNIEAK